MVGLCESCITLFGQITVLAFSPHIALKCFAQLMSYHLMPHVKVPIQMFREASLICVLSNFGLIWIRYVYAIHAS